MEQQLEERYIVLKLKSMSGFQRDALEAFLHQERLAEVKCVVVEKDWPEYAPTVSLLMRRVHGSEQLSSPHGWRCATDTHPPRGLPVYTPGCNKPPEGWHCTRAFGHAGPCATVKDRP